MTLYDVIPKGVDYRSLTIVYCCVCVYINNIYRTSNLNDRKSNKDVKVKQYQGTTALNASIQSLHCQS